MKLIAISSAFATIAVATFCAAGLGTALVAAPCQLIGGFQAQTFSDHIGLCFIHEGRHNAKLSAAAEEDRLVHGIVECLGAVRIGIPGCIVRMGAVKNHAAAL